MADGNSLVSSSSRPLKVRMRPDLNFVRQNWQQRDYWIVKDPLSLKFFRFEHEEYALLNMLDGQHSADEIRIEFARQFAPQKITNRELFQFIGSLHRSCLLVSDAAGQAGQLLKRADETKKAERRNKLTNILAIRFRGIDPDGFLTFLNRVVGWIFSGPAVIATLLFVLSAVALIFTNFEQFQDRLPGFQEFFSGRNWIWLGVVLAGTKVLHELGHGLACKRFGSQCHSMGVMFLVLMPCLYCDVSDSWTLRNKWRRIAIAAAGMYFEFILAAICAFVWWFSEPGWVNMLALNIVFVCSISTLLFNANPLLKFDGYYILSDLIEVPNLRAKASSVLKRVGSNLILGIQSPEDPFMPQKGRLLFATYSVLAVAYRWVITLSIFWFLYSMLEPYGLAVIGQGIAMMALWGLIGMPVVQLFRFLSTPGRLSTVNPIRFGICFSLALALIVGVLLIPVPHYVRCSFVVQPGDAAVVYIEMPGIIDTIHVQPQQKVVKGQSLMTLANPDLVEGILLMEGEEQVARQRYFSTRQQSHYAEAAEADVQAQLVAWQAATRQLQQRRESLQQLEITSPIAGRVISASFSAQEQGESGNLATWFGHPLENRNHGAFLEQGTIVCQVAPESQKLDALLAIDQADIEFISRGNPVELWLRQDPAQLKSAAIDLISPVQMQQVPRALSSLNGGPLNATKGADGKDVPYSTTYQVRVPLEIDSGEIAAGATGMARIRVGNQTIGSRLWRFACKTFRFDL